MKFNFYHTFCDEIVIFPTIAISFLFKEIYIGWLFWSVKIDYEKYEERQK